MKFIWDDTYAEIDVYNCELIDDDDNVLENIEVIDYTSISKQESAYRSHSFYPYSFKVNFYFGSSKEVIQMQQGLDYDSAYSNHLDENGCRMYGYNGVCTHTLEDVKRFCEEYLAKRYIDSYNYMLPNFNAAKRRASWFIENGYGQND